MTDSIRSSLEWVLQQLIEAEATAVIGAAPHERTETRTTRRVRITGPRDVDGAPTHVHT